MGKDGVRLPYQYNGDALCKLEFKNLVKDNNMDIAQWLIKKITLAGKGIREIFL